MKIPHYITISRYSEHPVEVTADFNLKLLLLNELLPRGIISDRDQLVNVNLMIVQHKSALAENFALISQSLEIKLHVFGKIVLQCQRCLGDMDFKLDINKDYLTIEKFDKSLTLPGQYEPILVENNRIDIYNLLAQEILLSIPAIPKHEDIDCQKYYRLD